MTPKAARRPLLLSVVATAVVMVSGVATALADQPTPPIIPAAGPKSEDPGESLTVSALNAGAGPVADGLALPYESWQGSSFDAPPARADESRPLPLARPRERPRRPFEVTAALAAFLPSCSAGSIDDRGCLTLNPGAGLEAALVYRVTPFFGVGLEGALSGFGSSSHGAFSSAGGGARYVGVVARLYFADTGPWDPYAALALGGGKLHFEPGRGLAREATSGLGARVSGGIDYSVGAHWRVGPSASFTHWLTYSEERCDGQVCRAEPSVHGRLLGFATLGFRVSGSFGDAL